MRNLTMLTDLYQLTMMYGYFKEGMQKNEGIFDLFFRPKEDVVYAVMAGTESVVEYINNIHFAEEDIAYLRSLGLFDESFLSYLKPFVLPAISTRWQRERLFSPTSRSFASARRLWKRSSSRPRFSPS